MLLSVSSFILIRLGTAARLVPAGVRVCMCRNVQEAAAVVKGIPVTKANNCDWDSKVGELQY